MPGFLGESCRKPSMFVWGDAFVGKELEAAPRSGVVGGGEPVAGSSSPLPTGCTRV